MIESSGSLVWAETATKFYNTVRVRGWFSNRSGQVVSVDVVADGLLAQTTSLGPEQTESTPGQHFVAQYMTSSEGIAPDLLLVFTTASGLRAEVSVLALAEDTHQTIGMHEMPWDFWRFSNTAWDALFNRYTGFEIIERELNYPNDILPMAFRPGQEGAEKAAGFEVSAVIVRKTGPCTTTWPLTPSQLVDTHYPQ